MSRIHDMGGRYGDGAIHPEPQDAPIFAQDWHARALAVTLACGALGQWNIDMSRHARECLSPSDYMNFSYYEKWLAALADLLVAQGVLSRADLSAASDTPDTIHPLAARHGEGAVLVECAERKEQLESVREALLPCIRSSGESVR